MQRLFICLIILLALLSCSSSNPTFNISFTTDVTTVAPGASATLSWSITEAQIAEAGVFASTGCALSTQVNGQDFSEPEAVACEVAARTVSPELDSTYRLSALKERPDTVEFKDISIRVADNSTLPPTEPEVNTPPFVNNDNYQVARASNLLVSASSGVLSNDVDNDGDALSAQLVKSTENGVLTLNSDGSFSYTHDGSGVTVDSFTYQASDGNDVSPTATAFIQIVEGSSENTAPVASPDSYLFQADTILDIPAAEGLLLNDSDLDGDELSVILVTPPVNGSLILGSDGGFNYTPNEDTESDSFSYQASDSKANSATVSVTLTREDEPEPRPILSFTRQISSSADDTEEHLSGNLPVGTMTPESPDLDMGLDLGGDKIVGIRFRDVELPKDATIVEAFVQFTVDTREASEGFPSINVYVVRSINPAAFSPEPFTLTGLMSDALLVDTWTPPSWSSGDSGAAERLDVTELLQGVVSRPAWKRGNAIALILEAKGDGVRIADSVDGNADGAARLLVRYQE